MFLSTRLLVFSFTAVVFFEKLSVHLGHHFVEFCCSRFAHFYAGQLFWSYLVDFGKSFAVIQIWNVVPISRVNSRFIIGHNPHVGFDPWLHCTVTVIFILVGTFSLHEHDVNMTCRSWLSLFWLDELRVQRSKDKMFVGWRQRSTCAEPMKDEVIPLITWRFRRNVPTIKKFAVNLKDKSHCVIPVLLPSLISVWLTWFSSCLIVPSTSTWFTWFSSCPLTITLVLWQISEKSRQTDKF